MFSVIFSPHVSPFALLLCVFHHMLQAHEFNYALFKFFVLTTPILMTLSIDDDDNGKHDVEPVSYTHLDVYKRQVLCTALFGI